MHVTLENFLFFFFQSSLELFIHEWSRMRRSMKYDSDCLPSQTINILHTYTIIKENISQCCSSALYLFLFFFLVADHESKRTTVLLQQQQKWKRGELMEQQVKSDISSSCYSSCRFWTSITKHSFTWVKNKGKKKMNVFNLCVTFLPNFISFFFIMQRWPHVLNLVSIVPKTLPLSL